MNKVRTALKKYQNNLKKTILGLIVVILLFALAFLAIQSATGHRFTLLSILSAIIIMIFLFIFVQKKLVAKSEKYGMPENNKS